MSPVLIPRNLFCSINSTMVKLNILGNYLTIVTHQEFFVFSYDPNEFSWSFVRNIRCTDSIPKSDGSIECCAFSPCEKYFGVYFDKNIIIYRTCDWSTLFICLGERKGSSLQFFPTSNTVLLADKSGCASFYVFKNNELQKIELGIGHNSMLTSALITDDEKFVITSDRDEKIRITNYPNVYNIKTYCLGHKMFVCCLGFLPMDKRILISSSGDGTIRFWDYKSGRQVALHDLNAENDSNENSKPIVTKFVSCEIDGMSVIALLTYKTNQVKIIHVSGDLNKGLRINKTKSFLLQCIPWDIAFQNKTLLCLLPDQKNPVKSWSLGSAESCENFDNLALYLSENWDSFLSSSEKISDEIPVLFKREVDNLQEYEQRKKARLLKTGKTS